MQKNNAPDEIEIELVYAKNPAIQTLLKIVLPIDATVEDAIYSSNILRLHPEIDLSKNKVGIFSELCTLSTRLKQGDRIEIYRPLLIDPKENRRLKAKNQK